MGALSNTSTLLSTCSSTNKHFRNGGSSSRVNGRYIVGSVSKACGKHLKRPAPRNPNVAIATQVINPSAIGGTLKNRRFVEHFGPTEKSDDEIGFLSHKRRSKCGKICCYGLSIAVTLIMMTGLILAVGYMQSEKQKISTRPVKLAQGQNLEKDDDFVSTSTTQPPTNLPKPALKNLAEDNLDDIDEIGLGEYADDEDMQNIDSLDSNSNQVVSYTEEESTPKPNVESDQNIKKSDSESQEGEDFESDDFDSNSSQVNTANNESYDSKNNEHNNDDDDNDSYSSAVKVLPPADFKFEGVSFEFPIYRSNRNQSKSTKTTDMNYGSVEEQEELDEEERKLETSINEVNSNFTSSNDSFQVDDMVSTTTTNEQNYANAQSNSSNPNKSSDQPDSLSLPSDSYSSDVNNDGSFSNENNNNNNNEFNFDSSNAKLETDIFDDEEESEEFNSRFETSASDDDQVKKASENNEKKIEQNPVAKQNNRYIPKNHEHLNRRGPRPKPASYNNNRNENLETTEKPLRSSDPKKLVLKPKAHKNIKSNENEANLFENYFEKKSKPNESQSPPISHTLPILEYKADFSHIQIPKDNMEPVKHDFQFPPAENNANTNINTVSNFKYEFTTPPPSAALSQDVKFNFKDFMNTNIAKNEYNFPNYSPPSASAVSTTDFNINIPQVQNLGNLITHTGTVGTTSAAASSLTSTPEQHDNNQFSKRTFYNYDSDPYSSSGSVNSFANTNSNPYLVGHQPHAGSIGSATSTGATLNLFQPQPSQSFNFDTSSSNGASYNLPSGTVPLDLSASHISVNGGSYGGSGASYSINDPNGAYSVTSLNSDLPYPNIGLNTPSNTNLGGTNNQGNAFSFSNYGQTGSVGGYGSGNKNGVEILTTGQGQVPTYNTITQGIHLLSLLNTQNPNPYMNNDQYSSASSYQPQQQYEISTKPQFQLSDFNSYSGSSNNNNDYLKGSTWRNPVDQNTASSSYGNGLQTYNTPQQFENNYAHDINPRNNYRSFESSDQLPSASTSSFSKSIVKKLASPDFERRLKSIQSPPVLTTSTTIETSAFRSLLSSVNKKPQSSNEPKSLSVSILPNAVGSIANSLYENFVQSSKSSTTTDQNESLAPKFRKRADPSRDHSEGPNSLNKVRSFNSHDLDSAGSEIHIVTDTNDPKKSLTVEAQDQTKAKKAAGGLKSGFYV